MGEMPLAKLAIGARKAIPLILLIVFLAIVVFYGNFDITGKATAIKKQTGQTVVEKTSPVQPQSTTLNTALQQTAQSFSCEPVQMQKGAIKPDLKKSELTASSLKTSTKGLPATYTKWMQSRKEIDKKTLQSSLNERKKYLLETMRTNPDAALSSLLNAQTREKLLKIADNCVEKPVSLEGDIEVVHTDSFEQKTSTIDYYIVSNNERLKIYPARGLKDALESRTKVKLRGFRVGNEVVFDGTSPFTVNPGKSGITVLKQPGNPPVLGEQKIAVILAYFKDTQQPSIGKEDIRGMVFQKTNDYYVENSYTKMSLSGDVFGWYKIDSYASCDTIILNSNTDKDGKVTEEDFKIGSAVQKIIKAADKDVLFTNYGRIIIVAPFRPTCGWGGMSTIGKITYDTADGNVPLSVAVVTTQKGTGKILPLIKHELGHSLGSFHANLLDCGKVSIAESNCVEFDYLDDYDVMGISDLSGHFNGPHKNGMGWFEPENIQTVTDDGTFELEPIETKTNGLKVLRIPRGGASPYLYVEYRQPIGYDKNFETLEKTNVFGGALLHLDESLTTPYPTSLLIDATPGDEGYSEIVLKERETFTDPLTNTKISVKTKNANSLTVSVDLPCPFYQTYHRDGDGDGYGSTYQTKYDCEMPAGYVKEIYGNDCDDGDKDVHPDAKDICDDKDNDCDEKIDEDSTFVKAPVDSDGDGYDSPTNFVNTCHEPRAASQLLDCNDKDLNIYPGAPELCDGKDNNCDNEYLNAEKKVCIFENSCGAFRKICNGNEQCQSLSDGTYGCKIAQGATTSDCKQDNDKDGYCTTNIAKDGNILLPGRVDCNDRDKFTNPGAKEICRNSVDDNCNNKVDESPCFTALCTDNDKDGYGKKGTDLTKCGSSTTIADCDDGRISVNPGIGEMCDGLDNDCNGKIDDNLGSHEGIESFGPGQTYADIAGTKTKTEDVCQYALVSCLSGKWQWDYAAGAKKYFNAAYETEEGTTNTATCNDLYDNDCDGLIDCGQLDCNTRTWSQGEYTNGVCNQYCTNLAQTAYCPTQGQGQGQGQSGGGGYQIGGSGE